MNHDNNHASRRQGGIELPLLAAALLFVAAFVVADVWWLGILAVVAGLMLFTHEQESRRKLMKRLLVVALFVVAGCLPLLIGKITAGAYLGWGTWGIDASGLNRFLIVVLRCLTTMQVLLLTTRLVPVYRLCAWLKRCHFPSLFIDLFELTYRYIYVLDEMVVRIFRAQTERLGYQTYRGKVKDTGLLVAQTAVLAQHEADRLYDGLVSRGYEDDPKEFAIGHGAGATAGGGDEMVRLRNLDYAYDDGKQILKQVNLTIRKGERIALLGENGSGKSTLSMVLGGIFRHSEGSYLLGQMPLGNDKTSMQRIRRKVGLVFQNSNHQLFTPSVYDEIAYGPGNMGWEKSEVERRVGAVIGTFGLQDIRHLSPHRLSEGRKKWVAIAAVTATEPDVIVLDEPTASLDNYYTKRLMTLLDEWHREGKTVILSTHDMTLACQCCDRVWVMHEGQLIADAPKDEVFARPELLLKANLAVPQAWSATPSLTRHTPDSYALPLFLQATTAKALVVGGGKGAVRKLQTLVDAGVTCVVITEKVTEPKVTDLVKQGLTTLLERSFRQGDTAGFDLVVAATADNEVNDRVCREAAGNGALYLSLTDALQGNFHFAATVRKKGIRIAVHTDHQLPEVAQLLRKWCVQHLPQDLESRLDELGRLRKALLDDRNNTTLQQAYKTQLSDIEQSLNNLC